MNSNPPIYYIKDGMLQFGDKLLFEGLNIFIHKGEKICLIGRNGCGKSSLIKVIADQYYLYEGEIYKSPGLKIAYLSQEFEYAEINKYKTVAEIAKQNHVIDSFIQNLDLEYNLKISDLSGGQKQRLKLAFALASKADILLLDEPTNHLDIKGILWLENYIKSSTSAIICISHDKSFLCNISNNTWWLDRAVLRKTNKGFAYFDIWQAEVIAEEEKEIEKLNQKLKSEELWFHQGVTARRKRNQKRLTLLKTLRRQLSDKLNNKNRKHKIDYELATDKKSKFIIEAEGVSFKYKDEDKYLVDDFSIRMKKSEIITIMGPNGCGKTTLLKLLLKQINAISGKVIHASSLQISYFNQDRSDLINDKTVLENLCPAGGMHLNVSGNTIHAAAYLKQFMLDPKILHDKVVSLSGGQKSKLSLAHVLSNPGNLMILDEPTNDLDMDSIEVLIDIISSYNGSAIIVSHDRYFAETISNKIIVMQKGEPPKEVMDCSAYQSSILENDKPIVKTTQPSVKSSAPTNSKKLSYKYKREQEMIKEEIETLEAEMERGRGELQDPDLYINSREKFYSLTKSIEEKQKRYDSLFIRLIEIEDMEEGLLNAAD